MFERDSLRTVEAQARLRREEAERMLLHASLVAHPDRMSLVCDRATGRFLSNREVQRSAEALLLQTQAAETAAREALHAWDVTNEPVRVGRQSLGQVQGRLRVSRDLARSFVRREPEPYF